MRADSLHEVAETVDILGIVHNQAAQSGSKAELDTAEDKLVVEDDPGSVPL